MRLGLDDNTRDALHFVLLGSGVMLLLRLVVAGIGLLVRSPPESDLAASIATFRNGYLLSDPDILVSGGMELPGRLAIAAIMCIAVGILAAILCALIARVVRSDVRTAALLGARGGSILALVWGLYAALLLPPKSARINADGITLIERGSLLDGISWPWPGHERSLPWSGMNAIEQRSVAATISGCGSHEQVVLRIGTDEHVIARLTPRGSECRQATREALERTAELATSLNSYRLR